MNRPWSDIDPEEEKLLAQWKQDTAPSTTGCLSPELIRGCVEECLPEAELARAKQHISECPMCAALSRDLTVLEMAGPSQLEARRMRARIGLRVEAVPEQRAARGWWAKLTPWVLAAGCAALAVGVWVRMDREPQNIAGNPTPAPDSPKAAAIPVRPAAVRMPLSSLVWRGEDNKAADAYPALLAKALEPYRANNYPEAIAALQGLAAKYPRRAEGHFYLGVSLLLADRPTDAIVPLENAKAAGESPVSPEISWYMAAALHNARRRPEAAVLLRSVCAADGIHKKEACAALAEK